MYNNRYLIKKGFNQIQIPIIDGYQLVWLKNIDRALDFLSSFDFSQYIFADIGAGTGIALQYVFENYKFYYVLGIEKILFYGMFLNHCFHTT